jgi:hypothetical protein
VPSGLTVNIYHVSHTFSKDTFGDVHQLDKALYQGFCLKNFKKFSSKA